MTEPSGDHGYDLAHDLLAHDLLAHDLPRSPEH